MISIVDLPERQIEVLRIVGGKGGIVPGRTHAPRGRGISGAVAEAAFGLWRKRGADGLRYQDRVRREWDE